MHTAVVQLHCCTHWKSIYCLPASLRVYLRRVEDQKNVQLIYITTTQYAYENITLKFQISNYFSPISLIFITYYYVTVACGNFYKFTTWTISHSKTVFFPLHLTKLKYVDNDSKNSIYNNSKVGGCGGR